MAHEQPSTRPAGASARQQAARLRGERKRRRATRGPLGRALAALFPSDGDRRLLAEERNWNTGATGEEMLARSLERRCPGVQLLHDRRAPGRRGNIDHIAVTATGVYVIDCKRYKGKARVAHPLFGPPRLMIDGRNRSSLVEGLARHVSDVRDALSEFAPDVPVRGCFCFVLPEGLFADGALPMLRTLEINGIPLFTPKALARRLRRRGALERPRATELAEELARRLPPAAAR